MSDKTQILLQAQQLRTKAEITIRLETLMRKIGEIYDINPAKIISNMQNHRIVEARAIVAFTLYLAGYSYSDIGKLLKRHHSTVMYYCDTIENKLGPKDNPDPRIKKILRYMQILDNNITDELISRSLYDTSIMSQRSKDFEG